MKGQELEDLRSQLHMPIEDFSMAIGVSPLDYELYSKKPSIENPAVLLKVHDLELREEEKNLRRYIEILRTQPAGPFGSGKILAHIDRIHELKSDPSSVAPITLEWHLSNRCDHDCPFCTFRESVRCSDNASVLFSEDLIEPLIEDMQNMKVRAVVYSGGGEPLLSPCIGKAMALVAKAGIHQGLITNGSRLGVPEIADAVLENCDWVRISVDAASQEVYEIIHGKHRNLAKTVENIKSLVAKRRGNKPQIGVSFLLTMANYTELLPAAQLFRSVGVDYFQVKPIVISAEERLISGNIFWRTGIFNQLVAVPDQATQNYKVYTPGFKFADMMAAIDRKAFRMCYGHPFYPTITATGDVYVCCLMIGIDAACYGTITATNRFVDIWNSPRRAKVGESINVRSCPINCKLSETNKTLEFILGTDYKDKDFLN